MICIGGGQRLSDGSGQLEKYLRASFWFDPIYLSECSELVPVENTTIFSG